jgi:hypothetical protein
MEEVLTKLKLAEEEILKLKAELTETKEHLKRYTCPARCKTYYANHKEEIIKKTKEYKEAKNYYATISDEKKKQYARTAYLNKKEKLKKQQEAGAGTDAT